jgi:hypothetical protein
LQDPKQVTLVDVIVDVMMYPLYAEAGFIDPLPARNPLSIRTLPFEPFAPVP